MITNPTKLVKINPTIAITLIAKGFKLQSAFSNLKATKNEFKPQTYIPELISTYGVKKIHQ
jgi:hypothetical protein